MKSIAMAFAEFEGCIADLELDAAAARTQIEESKKTLDSINHGDLW